MPGFEYKNLIDLTRVVQSLWFLQPPGVILEFVFLVSPAGCCRLLHWRTDDPRHSSTTFPWAPRTILIPPLAIIPCLLCVSLAGCCVVWRSKMLLLPATCSRSSWEIRSVGSLQGRAHSQWHLLARRLSKYPHKIRFNWLIGDKVRELIAGGRATHTLNDLVWALCRSSIWSWTSLIYWGTQAFITYTFWQSTDAWSCLFALTHIALALGKQHATPNCWQRRIFLTEQLNWLTVESFYMSCSISWMTSQ